MPSLHRGRQPPFRLPFRSTGTSRSSGGSSESGRGSRSTVASHSRRASSQQPGCSSSSTGSSSDTCHQPIQQQHTAAGSVRVGARIAPLVQAVVCTSSERGSRTGVCVPWAGDPRTARQLRTVVAAQRTGRYERADVALARAAGAAGRGVASPATTAVARPALAAVRHASPEAEEARNLALDEVVEARDTLQAPCHGLATQARSTYAAAIQARLGAGPAGQRRKRGVARQESQLQPQLPLCLARLLWQVKSLRPLLLPRAAGMPWLLLLFRSFFWMR